MHRFILEPALQSHTLEHNAFGAPGRIDGELYVAPGRRGDVRGKCKGQGHRAHSRLFHPFSVPDPLAYLAESWA